MIEQTEKTHFQDGESKRLGKGLFLREDSDGTVWVSSLSGETEIPVKPGCVRESKLAAKKAQLNGG